MKTLRWFCAFAVAALVVPATRAQDGPKPGPEHEILKKMEGNWDLTMKFGDMQSKGTVVYKMDLGGLWLTGVLESELFGTKFKIINGYGATPKIHLAMEAGEVMGVAATSWSTLKFLISEQIKEKKVLLLGQWGLKKHPELAHLPNWLDYAKTEQQKQALRLLLVRLEFGVPYFTPPETVPARLNALRRAFDATMKDPAYLAENEKAKLEVNPLTGEEVEALVKEAAATPADVAKIVRDAMAPPK